LWFKIKLCDQDRYAGGTFVENARTAIKHLCIIGYKFLDGKTGVEPEESELVASVELGHVQVLEGQEVDTSSSSPNYVEHLLAIVVLQVPQVIQHALLQNQHTPHLLQCPFHHQFLVAQQLPVSMVCWLGQALKMSNKLNAA
jgi:hypothetical protein